MTDHAAAHVDSRSGPRGWIWDIKRYSLHDGPGIRTTVFFKGCPLRCLWCCNPESQRFDSDLLWVREKCLACDLCLNTCPCQAVSVDETGRRRVDPARCDLCGLCALRCPGEAMTVTGRLMEVNEVLREVARDAVFYSRSGGGLTLSGGEPLAQAEFAGELLRRYKTQELGLSTAVETCGQAAWADVARVLPHTDLFLYDIKHMDPEAHRRYTGVDNERILDNARRLAVARAKLVVRLPLISGCNDSEENVRRTAEFARCLGVGRVDLLPYHRLGEPKYPRLDRPHPLSGTQTLPADRVAALRRLVEDLGLEVRIGG